MPQTTVINPAVLSQKDAAAYCGLAVETFKDLCPVKPVRLNPNGKRLIHYRRRDLDRWIDELEHIPARRGGMWDGQGEP